MTATKVQQARTAITAGAPRLTHIIEPDHSLTSSGLTVTRLWSPEGHDLAEYYTHDDGSFAGGNVGFIGGDQYPFTDLVAFVCALMMVGGRR